MNDSVMFPIHKNAMVAMEYRFHQRGHHEPVTPTPEQITQHARAIELVAELETNPYIRLGGYDFEIEVEPLKTETWVADETHDEWMTRWREHRAANPGEPRPGTPLDRMLADAFTRAFDRSPLLGLIDPKEQA